MILRIYFTIILALLIFSNSTYSQEFAGGRFSGNFQIDAQTYTLDSTIGAVEIPKEKLMSNSFFNLLYNFNNFEIGLRYEAYYNPILGFDIRYAGSGIPYRYITYRSELFDITAGDFYEQFGSGLIFRAYEERQLGFDNAVDGVRFKMRPSEGIDFVLLIGKQRNFWSKGEGMIRGGSIHFLLNSLFDFLPEETLIDLGGSLISKFEPDVSTTYKLPENVLAYALNLGIIGSFYSLNGEWAYKINDPNATNNFNYNPGMGLILNASYFEEGIGVALNFHRVDNMDFRSKRTAIGNELNLSFIPPLTKQQMYRFGTLYPYASQPNGEIGYQFELNYNIPPHTFLGGNYGMDISFNHSSIYSLDTTHTEIDSITGFAFRYDSPFFAAGDAIYYRDFNIELIRRWSDKFKTTFNYVNFKYNRDVLENEGQPLYGMINGNLFIGDFLYNISENHSIRFEIEYLMTKQDSLFKGKDFSYGNWLMFLVEYSIAPNFFISFWDEYNFFDELGRNGEQVSRNLHYLNGLFAFITGTTRISIGYGRQRGGLICVGGVCRQVPSSNGFNLSISSSF